MYVVDLIEKAFFLQHYHGLAHQLALPDGEMLYKSKEIFKFTTFFNHKL